MKKNKIVIITYSLILIILLYYISQSIISGTKMSKINNMYKDIETLEKRIAIYYLDNNDLPVLDEMIPFDNSINPNDNDIFYEIDLSKLENLELSYGTGKLGQRDKYIINSQSHTIYYLFGVEHKNGKIYTRNIEYKEVDLQNY